MSQEKRRRRYKIKRRVILLICIIILALLYAFKNTSFLLRSLSTIGFIIFFYIVDHLFDIDFNEKHYAFALIITFSSFLLSPLYFIYPQYDKIQHLIIPMMYCSIIFHMISHLQLHMKWRLTFIFFLVVGSLSLFELGEYTLDYFFNLNLQGVFLRDLQGLQKFSIIMDRLDDTMIDIALGVIGTLFYTGTMILWYYKTKTQQKFLNKNKNH
ncbi:hypothetical protein HYV49_01365 [Candidatus Pacearchaeota archaeon]|nr:hypothetical protein [Candidatus Pacearchaeota archaeon]